MINIKKIKKKILEINNLLFIQLKEFNKFLTLSFKKRKQTKIHLLLKDIFPILNEKKSIIINYIDYIVNKPIYSIEKCLKYNLTYEVDIKLILHIYSKKHNINQYKIVYLTKCPYITKYGSFIFNGAERVIVSQLYKPNSIFFYKKIYKNHKIYNVKIIPKYGIWIDMYISKKKILYFIIDKKKKILITTFLKLIGYNDYKDILKLFNIIKKKKTYKKKKKYYIYEKYSSIFLKKKKYIKNKNTYVFNMIKYKKYYVIIKTIIKDNKYDFKIIKKKIKIFSEKYFKNKIENIYDFFKKILFNKKKYKITNIMKNKLNFLFNLNKKKNIITKKEFIKIIKYLIYLDYNRESCLHIDDLSNRVLKTVYNQLLYLFKLGFTRLKKNILEKLNKTFFVKNLNSSHLFNIKIINSNINTFFGTNQLSQFMDQTNILSEITHKRRLSLLGVGGIIKNKAGYKIRDIHNSFYGRICPIETPEGPNIGLISSLCIYTFINDFNYLTTPYFCLKTKKIVYLPYYAERNKIFGTSEIYTLKKKYYICRYNNQIIYTKYKNINYIDIDTTQIISLSVAQIPFLEHDDANRILMGSNMIRQTVPLLYTKKPIISSNLDENIIFNSRNLLYAKEKGIIDYVDNNIIILKYKHNNKYVNKKYTLIKYKKTNQNTCINYTPIVKIGDIIKKNQILCQGYGTHENSIALGRDVLVAFMPFKGYNFEDAIIISDNIIKKNVFTSLHIEIINVKIKRTKLGKEKLTRNIYKNFNNKNLNKKGIIKIGSTIKPGDVLVGILKPIKKKIISPEMKLLHYIFNKKYSNMKNNSYKAHSNLYGKVLNVEVIKNNKNKVDINKYKNNKKKFYIKINKILKRYKKYILCKILKNKINKHLNLNIIIKKYINNTKIFKIFAKDKLNKKIYNIYVNYVYLKEKINNLYKKNIKLEFNVLKLIKIYIIKKRILQVGDKMSGRHGNKGVISKIVSEVDMPFLKNGKIINMILNPLGVPSRMNVGQILETILGMIGHKIKKNFFIKSFKGVKINEIYKLIKKNKLPKYCKYDLYDGCTGEKMHQKVTIGYIHMLKLNHMVEDKIHVRSTGPYSLITQQPLGGRSQSGGQRFGEMEVWALEAYGAAYFLRELLTIKSDDLKGRDETYNSIINNKILLPESNIPESFNVLIKELNGLNIDILFK
ncbi:MAG: DNA-directed RNA polymerase subunit beta [Candidatus Shikimatogenerans sp. Tduv]|uniref:DNA-directed RNA polymerase subunit beta n=1 Tax=Candidatus Shikimatogenerans sp. Tduv TaxID=3158567 RepID=A0AAU7QT70_9FLAO